MVSCMFQAFMHVRVYMRAFVYSTHCVRLSDNIDTRAYVCVLVNVCVCVCVRVRACSYIRIYVIILLCIYDNTVLASENCVWV